MKYALVLVALLNSLVGVSANAASIADENAKLAKLANEGDSHAALHRGVRYFASIDHPELGEADIEEGVRLLEASNKAKNPLGKAAMAHAYLFRELFSGRFDQRSLSKAAVNYTVASNKGVADATNAAAMWSFLGINREKNYAEAGNKFLQAAVQGSPSAQANLAAIWGALPTALLQQINFPVPENHVLKALAFAQHSASMGNPLGAALSPLLEQNFSELLPQVPEELQRLKNDIAISKGVTDPMIELGFHFKVTPDGGITLDDTTVAFYYKDPRIQKAKSVANEVAPSEEAETPVREFVPYESIVGVWTTPQEAPVNDQGFNGQEIDSLCNQYANIYTEEPSIDGRARVYEPSSGDLALALNVYPTAACSLDENVITCSQVKVEAYIMGNLAMEEEVGIRITPIALTDKYIETEFVKFSGDTVLESKTQREYRCSKSIEEYKHWLADNPITYNSEAGLNQALEALSDPAGDGERK